MRRAAPRLRRREVAMKPVAVIAIGGNSLARAGQQGTFAEQQQNAVVTCQGVAEALKAGYRVVLTHGNGPQVGRALLRSEFAQPNLPPLRLDECDAETEGEIGYLLQQTLTNVLGAQGRPARVASLVTQVVVDPDDPAFENPAKPIGPFYTAEEALQRKRQHGWALGEDAGRGWRRLVASPRPLEIVEITAVRACLNAGLVVIAAGGGGIPVVRTPLGLRGVDAVVDKDRASALLARALHADLLLFSTAVDCVARHFGRPDAERLPELTIAAARDFLGRGEFPSGSMGPKIEAAIEFLEAGGRRVLITSPENIGLALDGQAGTRILPDRAQRQRQAAA
jgi:carbamate kinase